jgi:orotate phosphoribosyltransferase
VFPVETISIAKSIAESIATAQTESSAKSLSIQKGVGKEIVGAAVAGKVVLLEDTVNSGDCVRDLLA